MKDNRGHLLVKAFYDVLSKKRKSSDHSLESLLNDFYKLAKESKRSYYGFIRTGLAHPPNKITINLL